MNSVLWLLYIAILFLISILTVFLNKLIHVFIQTVQLIKFEYEQQSYLFRSFTNLIHLKHMRFIKKILRDFSIYSFAFKKRPRNKTNCSKQDQNLLNDVSEN